MLPDIWSAWQCHLLYFIVCHLPTHTDFSQAGLPMLLHKNKTPRSISPPPSPLRYSPTSTSSSSSCSSSLQEDRKMPHPLLSSGTDMSATQHRGQTNKRRPQPKAEVSPSSSLHVPQGTTRQAALAENTHRTGPNVLVEQSRNYQAQGNLGAKLHSGPGGGGGVNRRRGESQGSKTSNHKVVDKDGNVLTLVSGRETTHLQEVPGWAKAPCIQGTGPVATRGVVSSGACTTTSSSATITSQSVSSNGGELPTSRSSSKHSLSSKQLFSTVSRGHRSNYSSEAVSKLIPDHLPSQDHTPLPLAPYAALDHPSTRMATLSTSARALKLDPPLTDRHGDDCHSPSLEYVWSSSQESLSSDWEDDTEPESLQLGAHITDDDKIGEALCSRTQQIHTHLV